MSYITELTADGELNTALQNFDTVCIANQATLGLTPANLVELAQAMTQFNATFNAATAAKASAKSAVDAKEVQKKTSKAVVSKYAKIFRANAAVPDSLLDQLMLPHHKTPGSKTAPTQPTNLVAIPDGNGLVALKWNRNGNTQVTQFLIESRTSSTGDWSIIGGTTKSKFSYQAVAGSYIAFRVTASRNNKTSSASVPVVLWDNGGSGSLKIAA